MLFSSKHAILPTVLLLIIPLSLAQDSQKPATVPLPEPGWTDWQGSPNGVRVRARLRDEPQFAAAHAAAVEVEVQGIWLHTPVAPSAGATVRGVLRYQLDHCPPVVTTDTITLRAALSRHSRH